MILQESEMGDNIINELKNCIESSDKSIKSLQRVFFEISKKMMSECVFKVKDVEFELTEIEFYYYREGYHEDESIHKDELQKVAGKLYVHNTSIDRGGIDITFGDTESYGGILIRGMKIDDKFVAGPSKVKNKLSKALVGCCLEYQDLQELFNKNPLLINEKGSTNHNPYISTRVGLGESHNSDFGYALYRFIREDYMNESKGEFENENKGNLREISRAKAITFFAMDRYFNEKPELSKVENNKDLMKNIKDFRDEKDHSCND